MEFSDNVVGWKKLHFDNENPVVKRCIKHLDRNLYDPVQ